MRISVYISRDYKDGDNQFIDELKAVTTPTTMIGKEYIAIVKNHNAWILRVNTGDPIYFEKNRILTSIINGNTIFIGGIPLHVDDVQNAISQLIYEYWKKTSMESDREAAMMYRASFEKKSVDHC